MKYFKTLNKDQPIKKPVRFVLLALFIAVSGFSAKPTFQDAAVNNRSQKTFYETGELETETIHDEYGNLAKILSYFKNGKIRKEAVYAPAMLQATTVFFPNGDTMCYMYFNHGIPEGKAFCYYENYKPAYENFYKDGYKSGTWRFFEENGDLRKEEIYEEGTSKPYDNKDFCLERYFSKNNLAFTVSVQNGKHSDTIIISSEAYKIIRPEAPPTGRQLFLANCASCHNPVKDAVGPMLKGVAQKREQEWLIKMIRNGAELIEKEDPQAVALYEKWGKTAHPDFTDQLTEEQTLRIINYMKSIK